MSKKKIPSWPLLIAAGTVIPSLLRSLWAVFVEGVNWSTQTWVVVCAVAFAWGLVAATVAWVAIPVRIKMTLDQFMFALTARMNTFEGNMSARVIEMHALLNKQLEEKEMAQADEEERLLATISMVLVPNIVPTADIPKGHCPFCYQRITYYEDRPAGHPDLYRRKDHGLLPDGTPCPAPSMYYLAQRLADADVPATEESHAHHSG